MPNYDAIIIGTGQSGPALARRSVAAGRKVAIIERKLFGGTCVNVGCTPTKTLVASAYVAHVARRAADYGVRIEGAVNVDMKAVKALSRLGLVCVEVSLKTLQGCTVYEGHGRFVAGKESRSSRFVARGGLIFINVGARAAIPPILGLFQQVPYRPLAPWTLIFSLTHLLILGGSYVGLEFAQVYRRFGSKVTVIEFGTALDLARRTRMSHKLLPISSRRRASTYASTARWSVKRSRETRSWRKSNGRGGSQRLLEPYMPVSATGRATQTLTTLDSTSRVISLQTGAGYPGGRPVAHQHFRHLGDGRLQWPRARSRTRRGMISRSWRRILLGQRSETSKRPHNRLCALHRSAPWPCWDDGSGSPQDRQARADLDHGDEGRHARIRER